MRWQLEGGGWLNLLTNWSDTKLKEKKGENSSRGEEPGWNLDGKDALMREMPDERNYIYGWSNWPEELA